MSYYNNVPRHSRESFVAKPGSGQYVLFRRLTVRLITFSKAKLEETLHLWFHWKGFPRLKIGLCLLSAEGGPPAILRLPIRHPVTLMKTFTPHDLDFGKFSIFFPETVSKVVWTGFPGGVVR